MAPTILNESNYDRSVVPLFHKLQMGEYLKNTTIFSVILLLIPLNGAIMNQGKKLVLLSFSVTYRLESTRNVQKNIATLLQWFCWGLGDRDFFDIATVEVLNDILRPMTMKLLDGDKKVDSPTKKPSKKKQRRNGEIVRESTSPAIVKILMLK